MSQDDIAEIDATSVVSVRSRCADSPQRFRHEFFRQRAVEVSFPEIRTEIVPFKIGKNIVHDKSLVQGFFDWWITTIRHFLGQRRGDGETDD